MSNEHNDRPLTRRSTSLIRDEHCHETWQHHLYHLGASYPVETDGEGSTVIIGMARGCNGRPDEFEIHAPTGSKDCDIRRIITEAARRVGIL